MSKEGVSMKTRLAGALIPLIVLSLFLSGCDKISGYVKGFLGGEKSNAWEDPAGDAPDRNYPRQDGTMMKIPALDIVKVAVEGKEGSLHADFKISSTFDKFFSYTDDAGRIHNMTMVELYIDVDNNASTGGIPLASKDSPRPLEGYDVYIIATPSLQYKEKDGSLSAISGNSFIDTNQQEMTGYYATYFIKQVPTAGESLELNTKTWHENKRKYSSISSDTLSIRVPYEWFGLKAGDTIRLCYKEMGQGAGTGKSFSEDKYLELK
jgi:hypothetical protein